MHMHVASETVSAPRKYAKCRRAKQQSLNSLKLYGRYTVGLATATTDNVIRHLDFCESLMGLLSEPRSRAVRCSPATLTAHSQT